MKTVLVCGGSKGIGAATTKKLLKDGFKVICLSRTIGELEEFKRNDSFQFINVDLSSKSERRRAIESIDSIENIWGVVNNSAGPGTGAIENCVEMDYISSFESHLFSANDFVKFAIPKMHKNGEGRIVNIISVTAKVPLENMAVSNTLRGAMVNWSKTLSKELARFNIKVNNVLPGYTQTQRLLEVIQSAASSKNITSLDYEKKLLEQIPLKRFGHPEEIGNVVSFLMSADASYINGASIPVDGGWTVCI